MNTREFPTRQALALEAASHIAAKVTTAAITRGAACAALSGGSTPAPAYRALANANAPWREVTFLLVDERFVPPGDPASNEGLIRATLSAPLASGARLSPLFAAHATLADAADRADADYAGRAIDIAVMGMGEDGHTASWFPHSPDLPTALDLANPRSVIATHAPQAAGATSRLTMTRSALVRTDEILLLITGAAKRTRLQQALEREDAPVAALFAPDFPVPIKVWWAP